MSSACVISEGLALQVETSAAALGVGWAVGLAMQWIQFPNAKLGTAAVLTNKSKQIVCHVLEMEGAGMDGPAGQGRG